MAIFDLDKWEDAMRELARAREARRCDVAPEGRHCDHGAGTGRARCCHCGRTRDLLAPRHGPYAPRQEG